MHEDLASSATAPCNLNWATESRGIVFAISILAGGLQIDLLSRAIDEHDSAICSPPLRCHCYKNVGQLLITADGAGGTSNGAHVCRGLLEGVQPWAQQPPISLIHRGHGYT